MFLGKRKEVLSVLRLMGEKACVYTGTLWPRYCDCKYGGPSERPGDENSGCPELASIYAVVSLMTDFEWADIAKRGGHGFADDAIKTVLDEMNKTLKSDKGCKCNNAPPMQPCSPSCRYPYTDEKVGGGCSCSTNCPATRGKSC